MDIHIEKITLNIPDALGQRLVEALGSSSQANRQGDVIEFIQKQLQEARDQFRFYGNLRAAIAWLPALISITIITFVSTRLNEAPFVIQATPAFILAIILGTIWYVQRNFQIRQFRANLASEEMQRQYRKALNGETIAPETIYEFMKRIESTSRDRKWEAASVSLGIFFAVLFLLYIGFIVYTETGLCSDHDAKAPLQGILSLICPP